MLLLLILKPANFLCEFDTSFAISQQNVEFQNVAVGDVWTAGDPPQAEEPPPPAGQETAVEPHSPEKPQGKI